MLNSRSTVESFDGIQYLRGIAALMVAAQHARFYFNEASASWTNFGATGVDIFFIISGFIMVHATRDGSAFAGSRHQAIDFLVRRAIRVIPLYWLALLYNSKRAIVEGTVSPGFLYDFLFIPRANPERAGEIAPSLPMGWTLNMEMVFYLLFAIAILFGSRKYLVLASSVLAVVLAGVLWDFNSIPLTFWTGNVFGEFALGIGVYFIYKSQRWAPSAPVAAILLMLGFAGLALPNHDIPQLVADGPFAAVVVWSALYLARTFGRVRPLSLLGDASYSIYLTHAFALGICYKILNMLGMSAPTPFNITFAMTFCVVASALLGIAVYYAVEKPMLKWMLQVWRNRGRLAATAAMS